MYSDSIFPVPILNIGVYDVATLRCSYNVCKYVRVSHSGTSNLKIPEILKIF